MIALVLALSLSASQEDAVTSLEPRRIEGEGCVHEAEVGRLRVPARRSPEGGAVEDGPTLELAFVRLLSTADDPGPPLVYLPGGPGNAAIPLAESPTWARFLALGDVLLLDPRGVGRSEPDLAVEVEGLDAALLFGDRETAVAHVVPRCVEAAAELAERGVDLRGLTSLEMADDVDLLRRALGYERVRLLAHSFGTIVGQELLRRHPGTVDRFVSVGTAGPGDIHKLPGELDASLRALSALVAADPELGEAMPDLRGEVQAVLADLAEHPLPVPVEDPRTGAEREVLLGPFGLQLLLVMDLGDTSDLPVFPRLIRTLHGRDPSVVRWFLRKRLAAFSRVPVLALAARGAQGATAARWRRIREEARTSPFGLSRCLFSPESDAALGVADVGDAARAPVASDVPTLFVSGTLDANTPPEQAERVRAGFARSGHVVVENGGHEDLLPDPRVQERILAFLAGADPADARLPGEPLRFAPLEGGAGGVDHPSLAGAR